MEQNETSPTGQGPQTRRTPQRKHEPVVAMLPDKPASVTSMQFTNEADAWRTCPICGQKIAPKKRIPCTQAREYQETWFPQKCACEIEAFRQKQAEERSAKTLENREARLTALQRDCYCWLPSREWWTPGLANKSFDRYEATEGWQRQALNEVQGYLSDPYGVLVLEGTNGVGKTHLLAALANELIKKGTKVCWATTNYWVEAINSCFAEEPKRNHQPLLAKLKLADLTIIDDMDKAKGTESRHDWWFSVINYRVENELPIAISTNRFEELESFIGTASADRLKTAQTRVRMAGKSYRDRLGASHE